jgi:hypothetical protein
METVATATKLQSLLKMFVDETPLSTDEICILLDAKCIKEEVVGNYLEITLTEYGRSVLKTSNLIKC